MCKIIVIIPHRATPRWEAVHYAALGRLQCQPDGAGIITLDAAGHVRVQRSYPTEAALVTMLPPARDTVCAIYHARMATGAYLGERFTHPFHASGPRRTVQLVHNGVVSAPPHYAVDSMALAVWLARIASVPPARPCPHRGTAAIAAIITDTNHTPSIVIARDAVAKLHTLATPTGTVYATDPTDATCVWCAAWRQPTDTDPPPTPHMLPAYVWHTYHTQPGYYTGTPDVRIAPSWITPRIITTPTTRPKTRKPLIVSLKGSLKGL